MDKDSKLTLHYFDARGGGEGPRMIMAYAKKDFTDHRVKKDDWAAFKATTPAGQLPVMEATNKDGKTCMVCQSGTICRMLGCLLDLNGKNCQEKIRADECFECLRDLQMGIITAMCEEDAKKKEELQNKVKTETAPRIFGVLEKRAKEAGGKSVAGAGITYADIALACFVDMMQMKKPKEEVEAMKGKFPTVFAVAQSVLDAPQIKDYLAKRPKTDH